METWGTKQTNFWESTTYWLGKFMKNKDLKAKHLSSQNLPPFKPLNKLTSNVGELTLDAFIILGASGTLRHYTRLENIETETI